MSNWEVSVLEHKYFLGIGCTGRTCHLASCNNFARDVSNVRTPLPRSAAKSTFYTEHLPVAAFEINPTTQQKQNKSC